MDDEYVIINKKPTINKEQYIEMSESKDDKVPVTPVEPEHIELESTVPEVNGLKLLAESNLTEYQKKLALNIYDTAKHSIQSFISSDINISLKITMLIGQMITLIEKVKTKPTGADKKAVVLQLGRILLREVTSDSNIFTMYDLFSDTALETMIRVSKVANVEIITKCCPFF